ncbi:MAG: hypothetical protein ABIA63_03135 [bacterium]
MIGIQLFPIAPKTEGAQTVLERIKTLVNADSCILSINCPSDAHTQPLCHGDFGVEFEQYGYYCFEPNPDKYKSCNIVPPMEPKGYLKHYDAVRDITEEAEKTGIDTYTWIQTFQIEPIIKKYPDLAMENIFGEKLDTWACPNNEKVINFNLSIIDDLLSSYPLKGIFIDRFRFPSIYDGIRGMLTCFCETCQTKAEHSGYDITKIKDDVLHFYDILGKLNKTDFQNLMPGGSSSGVEFLNLAWKWPGIGQWLKFRQESITDYVSRVYHFIKNNHPQKELGLDIWPPAYSWIVGQNYSSLSKLCGWIKPILYPISFGPAALAGELFEFREKISELNPDLPSDDLLQFFYNLFGFKFDAPATFKELDEKGFPSDVYALELKRARNAFGPAGIINAGCPTFDSTMEEVEKRVTAAAKADSNGIFYYCYDLTPLEILEHAGRIWAQNR